MSPALIALVFMLGGIGICLAGVFCYFLLTSVRRMTEAVTKFTAIEPLLRDRSMEDTAKSFKEVAKFGPELVKAFQNLDNTVGFLRQTLFDQVPKQEATPFRPPKRSTEPLNLTMPPPAPEVESAFIAYSEEAAAAREAAQDASRANITLEEPPLPPEVMRGAEA